MDDSAKKKDKNWFWPKIDSDASALEAAKAGAVGGGLMLAGLVIGLALVHFSGDYELFNAADLQGFYINQAVQIALAAFLTWRVYTGKGRFASILLLIWIVVEVAMKLAAGQLNAGWGIMWFFAIMSLVHSVRGSWALRRFRKTKSGVA
jgi:hypothetical protein